MRIIVCGAGQVGYGIAERLTGERNDVSIIDTSPELIQNVRDTLDARGFVGHGAHPDVLAAAGAADADMLVAVTFHDEVNIIACQVAHSLFNIPTKIARIRSQAYLNPQHSDLFSHDHLKIDLIISPERELSELVLRRIALPGASDIVRFAEGKVTMLAIECLDDCPVVNTPLSQLSELFPDLEATVVAIRRAGRLDVVRSADELVAGDLAYVVADSDQVRRTLGLFGHDEQAARRIVIAGGGNVGLGVARALERDPTRPQLRILESSASRAARAADELSRAIVLSGSALDQKLLLEADIAEAELMVALTNDDQVNVLSCVLAKRLGARSTLALVSNPTFQDMAGTMGVDAHVNPRSVTVSKILQHVRRGRIRSVHSIDKGTAEMIEAEALETSPLVGQELRELDLPRGVRIGAVYRGGDVLKPDGSLRIRPKDRVVVFAMADSVRQVEQFFRVSLDFF